MAKYGLCGAAFSSPTCTTSTAISSTTHTRAGNVSSSAATAPRRRSAPSTGRLIHDQAWIGPWSQPRGRQRRGQHAHPQRRRRQQRAPAAVLRHRVAQRTGRSAPPRTASRRRAAAAAGPARAAVALGERRCPASGSGRASSSRLRGDLAPGRTPPAPGTAAPPATAPAAPARRANAPTNQRAQRRQCSMAPQPLQRPGDERPRAAGG